MTMALIPATRPSTKWADQEKRNRRSSEEQTPSANNPTHASMIPSLNRLQFTAFNYFFSHCWNILYQILEMIKPARGYFGATWVQQPVRTETQPHCSTKKIG